MINPKISYHDLSGLQSLRFGGAIGANAQKLDEAIGSGPSDLAARYFVVRRKEALKKVSITKIEEAIGTARAVPDKLAELIGKQTVDILRSEQFRREASASLPALGVHTAPASSPSAAAAWLRGFNEIETLIRDAFDALFGFLENIQYAVDLNVITQDDVYAAPLSYYLGKLCEKDEWTHCAICRYLAGYGFPKTERLLRYYRARFFPKIEPLTEDQIQICNKDLESELRAEEVRKAAEIKGL